MGQGRVTGPWKKGEAGQTTNVQEDQKEKPTLNSWELAWYCPLGLRVDGTHSQAKMFSYLASCSLPSRQQTGVQGASGKPQGTVARAHVGQVLTSIHTELRNKEQQVRVSKKWGFTKFNADKFEDMVAEKRLIPVGCGVRYIPNRGPLDKWRALHS
ncbi:unnamed protein product [Nyctereutes procyonoides]|uniref:(raccoon dog) hypothetical protein n=1 Tax=Nyctereutes procyonoides TaxID=34880 RepID=A0A811YY71_NYCPR|nr:unnamed protein product [Nyctereutes procyonoides]